MQNLNDFLANIFSILPELRNQYADLIEERKPEIPPTIVVMSELARGINPLEISHSQETKLFNLLEDGLSSSDKDFGDAVATGMLECLLDTYNLEGRINDNFWDMLGEDSKYFIKGIIDFYQIEVIEPKISVNVDTTI